MRCGTTSAPFSRSLPPGATVWSAAVAGRPIRPGRAEQDGVLLPLEKGLAGQDAPTFVVELVYLQRIAEWQEKGRATLALPALDLPVSRTGVSLHYSPRFRIDAAARNVSREFDPVRLRRPCEPSAYRRRGRGTGQGRRRHGGGSVGPTPCCTASTRRGLQVLVERFRSESGGRTVVGTLPVRVAFPELGPSIFLAAEFTAEARAPSFEVAFRRTRD